MNETNKNSSMFFSPPHFFCFYVSHSIHLCFERKRAGKKMRVELGVDVNVIESYFYDSILFFHKPFLYFCVGCSSSAKKPITFEKLFQSSIEK